MEIYAEISNKLARQIESGYNFYLPSGVEVRKVGRRGYFFECDDDSKDELIDFLEVKGIAWQDNDDPPRKRRERNKTIIIDMWGIQS